MIRLALFALAPLAVVQPAPVFAQSAPAVQMEHISVQAFGRGSPVILIPGLSSPRETWAGIAPALAKTHRVYLVQVNGFGGDDPRGNLQPGVLDGIVGDLHALIARERIGGAAVIGHSLGGLVGLKLAHAHPGDIGRLMVVDSLPFIGTLFAPDASVAQIEPQARAMRDGMAAQYGKAANPAAAQAIAQRLAATPDAQAKVAVWAAKADPRVSAQAMYEDMTTDLRPDMAGIAAPITLVYPTSAAVPPERAAALYRGAYAAAPHVTYVAIADSAHFVMLDQPAAFAAAVTTFLH